MVQERHRNRLVEDVRARERPDDGMRGLHARGFAWRFRLAPSRRIIARRILRRRQLRASSALRNLCASPATTGPISWRQRGIVNFSNISFQFATLSLRIVRSRRTAAIT